MKAGWAAALEGRNRFMKSECGEIESQCACAVIEHDGILLRAVCADWR